MKRVKQINESKDMIKEGLISLLKKKKYHEITISDLAKEAAVSRMTLYRHFGDIDEVFVYYLESILAEVKNQIENLEQPNLSDLLCVRFRVLKASGIADILQNENQIGSMIETFSLLSRKEFSELLPNFNDSYLAAFISGGINSMTKIWIKNGMNEVPEEMTKKIMMVVEGIQILNPISKTQNFIKNIKVTEAIK
ncbi:MAG TPA: TetR/AcrR family transcriptional regulator [Fusibacter sp.]|nr:TetR/AcrR family transcriptional regulator [Fusibacter sp.]